MVRSKTRTGNVKSKRGNSFRSSLSGRVQHPIKFLFKLFESLRLCSEWCEEEWLSADIPHVRLRFITSAQQIQTDLQHPERRIRRFHGSLAKKTHYGKANHYPAPCNNINVRHHTNWRSASDRWEVAELPEFAEQKVRTHGLFPILSDLPRLYCYINDKTFVTGKYWVRVMPMLYWKKEEGRKIRTVAGLLWRSKESNGPPKGSGAGWHFKGTILYGAILSGRTGSVRLRIHAVLSVHRDLSKPGPAWLRYIFKGIS